MADALVTLPLNTGLRVDELFTRTWQRVHLQARSDGRHCRQKATNTRGCRRMPRQARRWRRSSPNLLTMPFAPCFGGKRGPYTARGIDTSLPNSAGVHKSRMCCSGSEAADHRQYLAAGVTDNRAAMADAGDLEIQLGLLADGRDRIGGV
jgi:hypothetical protein